MKAQDVIQVIFSIFIGIVVVAFVMITVNTFYPEPVYNYAERPPQENLGNTWRLVTSIILLLSATIIMIVSMLLPDRVPVIANGVLLGGLFTMIAAVGYTSSTQDNIVRFFVVTLALLVTVGMGYWRFTLARRPKPAGASAGPVGTAAAGAEAPVDAALAARVDTLEARLDAIGRAFRADSA